jgi:hypothetical protein
MIRRSLVSLLMGVLFAGVLAFGQSAAAHCMGYCGDMQGYYFAGCDIYLNSQDRVEVVVCAYMPLGPAPVQSAN